VDIWNRYIVGGDDARSPEVRQRRLVLQHVALFKRFGFERVVVGEAQAIASMIEAADPQLTWPRFQQIVEELRARKILQGEYTLYVTPKALHIKLWAEWWDTYGRGFNFQDFSASLPPELLEWFYDMFVYAAESQAASRIVKELLGGGGPFQTNDYLRTRLGANFF